MAIRPVDKVKILKYLRETPLNMLAYDNLMEYLGNKVKISDLELTDFFAGYVIDSFKKGEVSVKLLSKMLASLTSFINWLHDDGIEIEDILLSKLYSIVSNYEQYYLNKDKDNELDEILREFYDNLNKMYTEKIHEEVDVSKLLGEMSNLRSELEDSEKNVSSLRALCDKKERFIEAKKKEIVRLNNRLSSKDSRERELESKIKELGSLIVELKRNIATMEQQARDSENRYDLLSDLKDKLQSDYYNLKLSMKSLREKLGACERELASYWRVEDNKIVIASSDDEKEAQEIRIQALIIEKMMKDTCTIEELLRYLNKIGYPITRDKIKYHLNSIRYKMSFAVEIPEDGDLIEDNNSFMITVPEGYHSLEMLAVSDFHLHSFGREVINDVLLINEYCESHGIKYIINAGDFFSLNTYKGERARTEARKIVDKVIEKYPHTNGLIHAVLGGNHDKDIINFGVDPIDALTTERDDFVSLGYGHCKISFGGSVSILDTIGIHHPNRRFPEPVGDVYSVERMISSVANYYAANKVSNDDVYVDILGHIHKSGLDNDNGICIVPSYRKDRIMNGFWHLKVYFDDNNHISNIVFKPVIKRESLIPVAEINYTKKLVK